MGWLRGGSPRRRPEEPPGGETPPRRRRSRATAKFARGAARRPPCAAATAQLQRCTIRLITRASARAAVPRTRARRGNDRARPTSPRADLRGRRGRRGHQPAKPPRRGDRAHVRAGGGAAGAAEVGVALEGRAPRRRARALRRDARPALDRSSPRPLPHRRRGHWRCADAEVDDAGGVQASASTTSERHGTLLAGLASLLGIALPHLGERAGCAANRSSSSARSSTRWRPTPTARPASTR